MQLVDNANKLYPLSKLIKIVQVLVPTTSTAHCDYCD